MALRETWTRIEVLTDKLRSAARNDPDATSDLWQSRQKLLEDVLNESSLAALSTQDLVWLQEATEQLQMADQALQQDLLNNQKTLIHSMRKQQGDAKAINAYQTQQAGGFEP